MSTTTKGHVVRWNDGNPCVFLPSMVGTPYEEMIVSRICSDGQDNLKTAKNKYRTCGVALSPHKQAGIGNLCSSASPVCIRTCLDETGMGAIFPFIKAARQAKTVVFQTERDWFIDRLDSELQHREWLAARMDEILAARLNIFSDVKWERYIDLESFPNTMFYDYTKHNDRYGLVRRNYWVTFSRSESNDEDALRVLANAGNVAVVFYDNKHPRMGRFSQAQRIPKRWHGYQVFDGDNTNGDARFDDPRGRKHGRVIGLRLKASSWAKYWDAVNGGFAVPTFSTN